MCTKRHSAKISLPFVNSQTSVYLEDEPKLFSLIVKYTMPGQFGLLWNISSNNKSSMENHYENNDNTLKGNIQTLCYIIL